MRTFSYLCAIALAWLSGCRLMHEEPVVKGRSPLQPARSSPDSVALEIIWARFTPGDPALNQEVWRDIDETQIDPAVRRELASNGLRAGVIGGIVPQPILRVLRHGETTPDPADSDAAEKAVSLTADPVVHGNRLRLPRHQRYEIQASEVYESLPLLVSGDSELSGRTYQQAQAMYALRVDPQPDRTVRVELTPELHYGPHRLRYIGGDATMMRIEPGRQREVFDRLHTAVRLAPGEMLVLMRLPDAGSRLGHYFHTVDSADGPRHKLILIRLAEVPPSSTFAGVP